MLALFSLHARIMRPESITFLSVRSARQVQNLAKLVNKLLSLQRMNPLSRLLVACSGIPACRSLGREVDGLQSPPVLPFTISYITLG